MKPIRTIITRHNEGIEDIKIKIEEFKDKKVGRLQDNLPSEEECKDAFSSTSCSAQGDNKAAEKLKNTKNKINGVRRPIRGATRNLARLKAKLIKLETKIEKLEDILKVLDKLMPVLKIAAEALPLLLYSQFAVGVPFTAGNVQGSVIVATHAKIDALKAKIGEIAASIKTYLDVIPPKYDEIDELMKKLNQGSGALDSIKGKGDERNKLLELSYLAYIQNCALGSGAANQDNDGNMSDNNINNIAEQLASNSGDILGTSTFDNPPQPPVSSTSGDSIGNTGYPPNNTGTGLELNIDDLLGELQNQNKTEIIQKIFNADLEMVAYKRYKSGEEIQDADEI